MTFLLQYNPASQELTVASTHRSRREIIELAGAGLFGLGALQGGGASPRKRFYKDPTGTSPSLGVIRSGHLLFVSGVGGWYPSRGGQPGDIRKQTADALDLMKALLEGAGASMADLLQVQVALVDSDRNWEPMNEVYTTKVPEPRPVRSYFGCTGFGTPGQLVQIDAIAYAE